MRFRFRDKAFYFGSILTVAGGFAINWYSALRICYDHPPVCTTSIGFPFMFYPSVWNEPSIYLPGLFGDVLVVFAVAVVAGLALSAIVNKFFATGLQ